MFSILFSLLMLCLVCDTKHLDDNNKNIQIKSDEDPLIKFLTRPYNIKKRQIDDALLHGDIRDVDSEFIKNLGPVYVNSNEEGFGTPPSSSLDDFVEVPSITYAPPFSDDISINFPDNADNVVGQETSFEDQPHSTLIENSVNDEFRPNEQLLEIVEEHIKNEGNSKKSSTEIEKPELNAVQNSNNSKHENDPLSSYHAPIYGKKEAKVNESIKYPRASYGIPEIKATPYPPYNLSTLETNERKVSNEENDKKEPPPRSYGVPDQKIEPESLKIDIRIPKSIDAIDKSAEKNNTSYSVPSRSVLALPPFNFNSSIVQGIPGKDIVRFKKTADSTEEIKLGAKHVSAITDDLSTGSIEHATGHNCCDVEILNSLSRNYDLKDGVLSKKQ